MFRDITVPNERTRIYLAVSLIDQHTISINQSLKRFGKTMDLARREGRYYTDKAPGSSFLGAAVYGTVRLFTSADDWDIYALLCLMRTFLMAPFGILSFFLLRRLLSTFNLGDRVVDFTAISWILGTSAFHYSTAYYGHQLAAFGFLAAMLSLRTAREGRSDPLRMLIAGAACGFSGLMEYQSAVPSFFFLVYIVVAHRKLSNVIWFLAGGLPFAAVLLGYNWAAFGGPLELSYQHLVSPRLQHSHSAGIGGVSIPKAVAIWGALFSLHRGWISTSPLFALVPFGLWRMWRSGFSALAALIAAIVVFFLLFIFGADIWHGAWSFGPRLLVPMMGIAMVPVAFAVQRWTKPSWLAGIIFGLGLWGIFYHQSVHLVFPEMPEHARNPILDLVWPALVNGRLSPNLISSWFRHTELWSIFPLYAVLIAWAATTAFRWQKPWNRPKKIRFFALIPLPLILFSIIVLLAGPSWSPAKTDHFLGWMKRMERKEFVDRPTSRPPRVKQRRSKKTAS